MNKSFVRAVYNFTVLCVTALLVSCGGGGGGGSAGTGTLNLSLTDAPNRDYKAVYVTINEVWVKHEGKNWEMLNGPDLNLPQTLNLLDFVNGTRAQLGIIELEAGHYNQMRLIVEDSTGEPQTQDTNILDKPHPYYNYVIDSANKEIFLKVPSGGESGIKLVSGFDIGNSTSTEIILDFDANKSVHAHSAGKTGEWRLRPTIKVVEINNSVSGVVDELDNEDDSGAWVSAQINDTSAIDFKDEVESVAGVFSNMDGTYFMFLPINTSGTPYNIVATKGGFLPECQVLDSVAPKEYTGIDFTLTLANKIANVSGTIVGLPVPGGTNDNYVNLSIRKFVDCNGDDTPETMVELEYLPFVNDQGNPIPFGPITLYGEGQYEIVVSAGGAGTYPPIDIVLDGSSPDIQDIDLEEQIDFGY